MVSVCEPWSKYYDFLCQVGKENAAVALSLVGYDEELKVCFHVLNLVIEFCLWNCLFVSVLLEI